MDAAPCQNCHVCGAEGNLLYENLPDRLFSVSGQWNLRKCKNAECGSLWMDPMPLESELHKAYKSYYTHGDGDPRAGVSKRQVLARRVVRWLELAWLGVLLLRSERRSLDCMYLDRLVPGRMLELGCGDGRRIVAMQKLGWEVEGQDVDPRAVATARRTLRVNVHLGDLAELALPAESYDAITMNHVIEHVYDPTALVAECRRLLRRGGVLISVTPNPNSYGHGIFGAAWRGLEPPRHLHLFSAPALGRIADATRFVEWETWTTPARAGGILAASLDIKRSGRHIMRDPVTGRLVAFALLYSLAARIVHLWRKDSGEEVVLRGTK